MILCYTGPRIILDIFEGVEDSTNDAKHALNYLPLSQQVYSNMNVDYCSAMHVCIAHTYLKVGGRFPLLALCRKYPDIIIIFCTHNRNLEDFDSCEDRPPNRQIFWLYGIWH